ncbi:MAG: DUF4174 domain-containing protein [Paracoccaceae bacterium]|nr:DUF4174 domain-containing protein [Paracoccaceae bacterium]MDE2913864.1 DUF4174 domain-containing protein [Paracoccaceae bacterium]
MKTTRTLGIHAIGSPGHVVYVLILGLALTLPRPESVAAQVTETTPDTVETGMPSSDVGDLSSFLWVKRPIVVFADSPNDPNFIRQIELLDARAEALEERDVVVLTDTDPVAQGPLRQALRPRGFMLVLLGKDGEVKLRKPFPWSVREISRAIDKMPLRQQEMLNR